MIRSTLRFTALAITVLSSSGNAQDALFHTRPGSSAPFSPAVRAGDLIFLSGQIGARADGSIPTTMSEQAKAAMENLRTALTLAGATFDDVVKCAVMLDDMGRWDEFNVVYRTYFKAGQLPARSAFGTRGLALDAGVEVECIAYKPLAK